MDEPEEVVPLGPGHGLLPEQLEDGGPHGGPLVLEGQLVLVLEHDHSNELHSQSRMSNGSTTSEVDLELKLALGHCYTDGSMVKYIPIKVIHIICVVYLSIYFINLNRLIKSLQFGFRQNRHNRHSFLQLDSVARPLKLIFA